MPNSTVTQITYPGATYTYARGINSLGQIVGVYGDSKGSHGFIETNGIFTTIDVPGARYTEIFGINNSGQVVGYYYDGSVHGFISTDGIIKSIDVPGAYSINVSGISASGQAIGSYSDNTGTHSFLYTNGVITNFELSGATSTSVLGINSSGQIVGAFYNDKGSHGFLNTNGTLTTIDAPGASSTFATGINASGQIVGFYHDSNGDHGFLYKDGIFTTIADAPSFSYGAPSGVGANGQIVGGFQDSKGGHGFIDDNGTITTFDVPGSSSTQIYGINPSGLIVGSYLDGKGGHGFLNTNGTVSTFDIPNALSTNATGINALGQIIGNYYDDKGGHGFLNNNNVVTILDVPGAQFTQAYGINNLGQIVGTYSDDNGGHGFLNTNGNLTTIDAPGAYATQAFGINDLGQIVGNFSDSKGGHGFFNAGGSFTVIDVPGAVFTIAQGFDAGGQIFGVYGTNNGSFSFAYKNGNFTYNDIKIQILTPLAPLSINDLGQIVGQYTVGGEAASFFLQSSDTIPPSVSSITLGSSQLNTVNAATGTSLTVTFSEAVKGFDAMDLILPTGAHLSSAGITSVDGGITWNGTLQADNGIEISGLISVSTADQWTDLAGNIGIKSDPTLSPTLQIDTKAPVLSQILARDTGASATDRITSDATVKGTGDANATVSFTVDGKALTATTKADSNGTWTFTPTGLVDGKHTIVASETDAAGNMGSASLTFTLNTNRAPTAVDDTANVVRGKTVTGNVLANDTDPDRDALSVAGAGTMKGAHGTLTLKADGSYSYLSTDKTLSASGYAKDTFNFSINDGYSHTVAETLTIFTTADGKTSVFDGSAGGQTLKAGTGSQILVGGPNDVLTGGDGADTFVFGPNAGKNIITDFDPRTDKLVLDHTLMPSLSQLFSGSAYIQQTNGDLIFSNGHGDTLTLQHTTFMSFLLNVGHDVLIV